MSQFLSNSPLCAMDIYGYEVFINNNTAFILSTGVKVTESEQSMSDDCSFDETLDAIGSDECEPTSPQHAVVFTYNGDTYVISTDPDLIPGAVIPITAAAAGRDVAADALAVGAGTGIAAVTDGMAAVMLGWRIIGMVPWSGSGTAAWIAARIRLGLSHNQAGISTAGLGLAGRALN